MIHADQLLFSGLFRPLESVPGLLHFDRGTSEGRGRTCKPAETGDATDIPHWVSGGRTFTMGWERK